MNKKQFSFRRYKNKDADVLFRECQKYTYENVQPYFSSGIALDKEHVLSSIQKHCDKVYRPPIIVDENDDPFGF